MRDPWRKTTAVRIFSGLCGFWTDCADFQWVVRIFKGPCGSVMEILRRTDPESAAFSPKKTVTGRFRTADNPHDRPKIRTTRSESARHGHRAAHGPVPSSSCRNRARRNAQPRATVFGPAPTPVRRDAPKTCSGRARWPDPNPGHTACPQKSPCGTRVKHRSQTHTLTYNPFSIDSTSVDKESGTGGTEKVKSVLVERLEKTPEQEGSKIRCRENPIVAADVARSQLDTELDIRIRI